MSSTKTKPICLVMLAIIVGLLVTAFHAHDDRLAEIAWRLGFYASLAGIPGAVILGIFEATSLTPKLRWPAALSVVSMLPLLLWLCLQLLQMGGTSGED